VVEKPGTAFRVIAVNILVELNKYQKPKYNITKNEFKNPSNYILFLIKKYCDLSIRLALHPAITLTILNAIIKNICAEVKKERKQPSYKQVYPRSRNVDKRVDLLILDTLFPHPVSRWRNEEFCNYLYHFPKSLVLTTGLHFVVVKETKTLQEVIDEFEYQHPELKGRTAISSFDIQNYSAKLAYLLFLHNTLSFLTALECKKIPFVFTLYPGGLFVLNQEDIDCALQRVFISPQFRKVIVTQPLTYDYLLKKDLCSPEKIEYIYGGVMAADILVKSADYKKRFYGFDKNTLEICFVAFRYMKKGIDKGYDIFIKVAEKLTARYDNINFHVVGTFNKDDIPVHRLKGKITFYGVQALDWFDTFYIDKDIIVSPNIPFVLAKGAFDGFPTASCIEAGLRKTAILCTDELKLNRDFIDHEDIIIIPHAAEEIVYIIEELYNKPDKLRSIGEKGAIKLAEVFGYEKQVLPRIRLLEKELGK